MGYKKEDKEVSDIIIKELSILPIIYNGYINIIIKIINRLKGKFHIFNNFITNYFIENKLTYFKDNSLKYSAIPKDCDPTIFLKIIIGKSRIYNWAIFIHFIKKEIERSLEKLLEMLSLYLTL